MGNRARTTAIGIAAVRLGAGVSLGGAPGLFLKLEPQVPRTSMPLLLRTVGIRDLAVGLGTAAALRGTSPDDLRRWLVAGLVSDTLDVVAGLAGARTTGARGVVSALIAAPMVVAGIYALSQPVQQLQGALPHLGQPDS